MKYVFKKLMALTAGAFLTLFTTSCSGLITPVSSSIIVSFPESSVSQARSTVSVPSSQNNSAVQHYCVTITSGETTIAHEKAMPGQTVTFKELDPGTYKITADGWSAEDESSDTNHLYTTDLTKSVNTTVTLAAGETKAVTLVLKAVSASSGNDGDGSGSGGSGGDTNTLTVGYEGTSLDMNNIDVDSLALRIDSVLYPNNSSKLSDNYNVYYPTNSFGKVTFEVETKDKSKSTTVVIQVNYSWKDFPSALTYTNDEISNNQINTTTDKTVTLSVSPIDDAPKYTFYSSDTEKQDNVEVYDVSYVWYKYDDYGNISQTGDTGTSITVSSNTENALKYKCTVTASPKTNSYSGYAYNQLSYSASSPDVEIYFTNSSTTYTTYADLKTAVENAQSGTFIVSALSTTDTDTETISISGDVTIQASADVTLTRTTALSAVPLFTVADGGSLTLGTSTDDGTLTLDGGYTASTSIEASAPLIKSCGKLTLGSNVVLQNNYNNHTTDEKGDAAGGAVYCSVGGTSIGFILDGATIKNNYSSKNGGGIYIAGSSVDSTVVSVSLKSGSILSNTSANHGAGIVLSTVNAEISGDIFIESNTSKSSSGDGGGVYLTGTNTILTMSNGTISENTAVYGGGIYVNSGTLYITGGTIKENSATTGKSVATSSSGAVWYLSDKLQSSTEYDNNIDLTSTNSNAK